MTAGKTNIEIGSLAVPRISENDNDCVLNFHICTVTNPFATGCMDSGWVGLRCPSFTVYGYTFNVHESELFVFTDEQKAAILEVQENNPNIDMFYSKFGKKTQSNKLSIIPMPSCIMIEFV